MRERTLLPLLFSLLAAACGRQPVDYATALAEARALVEVQQHDEAYAAFDRLRQQYPEAAALYTHLARTAIELGRPQAAIPALEERIGGEPADAGAHEALATLFDNAGRWPEAERHYRESVRLDPGRSSSYRHLFRLLVRGGKYSQGLEAAAEGLRHSPDDVRLRTWYGEALMKLRQRWTEAEDELQKAIALPDSGAHPHYVLGLVYLNTGKLDAARTELETATELDPGSARAWYQLANVHGLLGDRRAKEEALEQFEAAYRRQLETVAATGAR
ncbi:MAG: tetratricopeptide repeat protein [Thermoanaerobaculia bacterium]